jgi:hypothetical protein
VVDRSEESNEIVRYKPLIADKSSLNLDPSSKDLFFELSVPTKVKSQKCQKEKGRMDGIANLVVGVSING